MPLSHVYTQEGVPCAKCDGDKVYDVLWLVLPLKMVSLKRVPNLSRGLWLATTPISKCPFIGSHHLVAHYIENGCNTSKMAGASPKGSLKTY